MLLQRNNPPKGPPPWSTPDAVPAEVTDVELRAMLAAGRADSMGLATSKFLEVEGIRCPYVVAGTGAPVLLVHGLGHDLWDWTDLFALRPSHLSFSALDLPGFGLAEKPDRDYPLALLGAAILAAASETKARTGAAPVVVASSLGGHVAMLAALQAPEAFAGLVLVSPGGLVRVGFPTEVAARAYYSEKAILRRSSREIVANCLRIFRDRSPRALSLAARKLAVHRSSNAKAFARPFSRVVTDVFKHPVQDRLSDIVPPVCMVFGTEDKVVPPNWCRNAAPKIGKRGARVVALDGLGHLPMVEDPPRFWSAVRSFVDRTLAVGDAAGRSAGGREQENHGGKTR